MTQRLGALALLGLIVTSAGCSGSSSSNIPTSPGPTTTSVNGLWRGTASDSSTATLGSGGMMGQAGMGTMSLQLVESGSTVNGTVSFSGMASAMMTGTFSGTVSGEDIPFTIDMPVGSMMSSGCSVHMTGTLHLSAVSMTMTGNYSGMNSCDGAFDGGQMTMTRP